MSSKDAFSLLLSGFRAGPPRPAPLERSYWVLPGSFLAGAYPGAFPGETGEGGAAARLGAILDSGIRRFLSLNEEVEIGAGEGQLKPYGEFLERLAAERGLAARSLRRPIPDYGVPGAAGMEAILDEVDAALASGEGLYLHCWGGLGRTGTVLGCWLARHGLARGEGALAEIGRLRAGASNSGRPSPESGEQLDFVRRWPPIAD